LMVTWTASRVDLDPGCVLYGMIETAALDTTTFMGLDVPRAAVFLAIVLVINLGAIVLFYKELKIVAFDAALATSVGIAVPVVHYGLITLVTATTVASFEVVGSILVITMLVAPGATAHLLTDRLGRMLVIASGLAVSAAVLGYLGALYWNTSVAGMISVAAGVQFVLAVVFAPQRGVVPKVLGRWGLSLRIAREDVLADVFRSEERGAGLARAAARPGVAAGVLHAVACWSLRREGFLSGTSGNLTPAGRERAQNLVRSHRLWESYLAANTTLPLDHLHEASHRVEHFISESQRARLARELDSASDPHGRRIPPEGASRPESAPRAGSGEEPGERPPQGMGPER
jgi:manganese/zinc/iron transport system permease protein